MHRILIADDEPLARTRIRSFLRDRQAVEISGEYANGTEALEAILRDPPDIAFVDVQMPGCSGLQLMADLPRDKRPAIILATAHDRFAIEAFDAQVIDYLLKPFDQERFNMALDRAIDSIARRLESNLGDRLETALAGARGAPSGRLVVKADGRHVFLKPEEIVWVEAANNYVTLHLSDAKRLLLRETLSSLEKRLGTATFARVNRSALVHMGQLQEIQPSKYGDYVVVLRNGTRLPLSRSLRGRLTRLATDSP
jgi:two-component system, LytTR family, response regulator